MKMKKTVFLMLAVSISLMACGTANTEAPGMQKAGAETTVVYSLEANDVSFDKNGAVTVDAGDVTLLLREEIIDEENVSTEDFIEGGIEEQIEFTTAEPEMTRRDGTTVVADEYLFRSLESGTDIDLKITEDLRSRLQLDTCNLTIHVK